MRIKNKYPFRKAMIMVLWPLTMFASHAQDLKLTDTVAGIPVNYDEKMVEPYVLPDPLILLNGEAVSDSDTWFDIRRPEILRLFEENQFGISPGRPAEMSFNIFDNGTPAFDSLAIRRQVTVCFSKDTGAPKIELVIYLPVHSRNPAPLLMHISFLANYTLIDDPGIKRGEIWNRDRQKVTAPENSVFGKLDVKPFFRKGIGFATFYYGDVEPDFSGGTRYGVRGLYLQPDQTESDPDDWGAIAAWAWGLSRAMDYFETDTCIDANRVALLGASRLGKTVLWAGACDQRFAMVIASCSGEGGAALSRRNFGETAAHLASPQRYHYQFCHNYKKYSENLTMVPMDAHMLLALIAPRPLMLQTGSTDRWSDPKGEFLSAVAATPVYRLLGKEGLGTDMMPPAGEPLINTLGYYMHEGGHGIHPDDRDIFLEFMEGFLIPVKHP
ncbi:MAG: acetylxylan esterase [Bacteroidales bacterium]|nr:acetylxylan esterase [Bacteroidales bacterium]